MATLHPVETALPPHRFRQAELREVAANLLPEGPGRQAALDVFDNSRIEERAFAVPLEWLLAPHGWKDRTEAFLSAGLPMAEESARKAIDSAGLRAGDVSAVVSVCTTGLATPSLESRLANRLGLRTGFTRMPLWGLGCAGGVAGVARAQEAADARGGDRHVLVVALELCSLAFDVSKALGASGARTSESKKALVAATLFADGCAAAVVSGDRAERGGPLRIAHTAGHLFPGTERVMGWDVEDHTLDVVLSPGIPDLVAEHFGPVVDACLAGRARPGHWLLHPGGAKVVEAARASLRLGPDDLRHTEEVLRRHGNMSSPTALFVLQEAMRKGQPASQESALLAALGPGFAAEIAVLERA